MKYYELTKEEDRLLKEYDAGAFKSVSTLNKATGRYRDYVKGSLDKTRAINIRLSERDLRKIKAKAVRKGLPYQTLVASVLHQYILDR